MAPRNPPCRTAYFPGAKFFGCVRDGDDDCGLRTRDKKAFYFEKISKTKTCFLKQKKIGRSALKRQSKGEPHGTAMAPVHCGIGEKLGALGSKHTESQKRISFQILSFSVSLNQKSRFAATPPRCLCVPIESIHGGLGTRGGGMMS